MMRIINSQLLDDKMEEAVTHYINNHQSSEAIHVDTNSLALGVQNDHGGRVVTVVHSQNFPSPDCRQAPVNEQVADGPWGDELMDPDGRIAAMVAHLTQQSRNGHIHQTHQKMSLRNDVEQSVMLDAPLRIFNGPLDQQQDQIVVVPHLPPLPPLQEMKRCQDSNWFNSKSKSEIKILPALTTESEPPVLELGTGTSPAHNKTQSKKSLPHKKRISKKLKKNTGNSTPQQNDIVGVINDEVPQEEILPDSFVSHQEHIVESSNHLAHEVRSVFICQLCGDYYGEEQFKFFQHLKQHYEPQTTIIIENPVSDLGIDKMTNTCIVDNVSTLPDSIVELSLDNTVPKSLYQPLDKHTIYTTSDKSLNYPSRSLYTMAHTEKVVDVPPPVATESAGAEERRELYESLVKLDFYSCCKCNKSFQKKKQCEAHIKEFHNNAKLEVMSEFSEPEDLMEGIHVSVEEVEQYEQTMLPHLTVENGQVHQEHVRHWYTRNGGNQTGTLESCTGDDYNCPVCPTLPPPTNRGNSPQHLKEEVLQRILENQPLPPAADEQTDYNEEIINGENENPENTSKQVAEKLGVIAKMKPLKRFECMYCHRTFSHRNSLLYHILSHTGKQHVCRECGKGFYTTTALKVHRRIHNGDRPYKCDQCSKEFRQWSDVKYHKNSVHSNEKQFKCDFCGKEFARKYSLSVHRRIHTGERNYKCEYCSKTFRASSYRLSHMRIHTGDRPYKCEVCGKCFRVAGDLKRHELTHIKEKQKQEKEIKKVVDKSGIPKTETKSKSKKNITVSTNDKKQKSKKNMLKKLGAPNVTVNNQNKFTDSPIYYDDNIEVFESKPCEIQIKFSEVYSDSNNSDNKEKDNNYHEQDMVVDYKNILKPVLRNGHIGDIDKTIVGYNRTENSDGKMTIYTHVERNGPVAAGSQLISDIRNVDRDPRDIGHDVLSRDTIESGFLERYMYNIPAV